VQHRALLRDVELLAPEHLVDARAQAAFLRQAHQQGEGLVADPVFRVVEEHAGSLGRQPLASLGVVGEELPEVHALYGRVMRLQRTPRGERGDRLGAAIHGLVPSARRGYPDTGAARESRSRKPGSRLTMRGKRRKILVVDVGGTNLKVLATGKREPR
jgi:hypothetical protein